MNTTSTPNPVLDNTLFESAHEAISAAISRNDGDYMELMRTGAHPDRIAEAFDRGRALQAQFLAMDPADIAGLNKIIEEHRHGPA